MYCIYVCIVKYMYIYIYIYTYIWVCAYIFTYMYLHTNACTIRIHWLSTWIATVSCNRARIRSRFILATSSCCCLWCFFTSSCLLSNEGLRTHSVKGLRFYFDTREPLYLGAVETLPSSNNTFIGFGKILSQEHVLLCGSALRIHSEQ